VSFSPGLEADIAALKKFLRDRVYRSPRVMSVMRDAEDAVAALFGRFLEDEMALPAAWLAAARGVSGRKRARVIGDFVAGMTDRYAMSEHRRLFDATPELR